MLIAILADIHSNLEALSAILKDAKENRSLDRILCLGDTVGYGPDPTACLDLLLGMDSIIVAGNHDLAAVGKISLANFNGYAAEACRWTTSQLSHEHSKYLSELPTRTEETPFTMVHGSPRNPVWEYVISLNVAQACFDHFTTPYCLVGHSHIPFICQRGQQFANLVYAPLDKPVILGQERLIINPGGVGQPRDGDPRASYAIYDTNENSIEFRRVSYDLITTQKKIRLAGLPEYLAERLQYGR